MLKKSSAIDRLLRDNPKLRDRRFGLPDIGSRLDGEYFNPTVQAIADAIDFYGFEVRDEFITTIPDIDLGNGNPTNFKPFPLSIEKMKKSLDSANMYKYPYTEGDDNLRSILLDYVENLGFVNNTPYNFEDIDECGLSVHNLTFLPSTSIAFNMIVDIISEPGDVILIPGPNYGLFTIRAERAGAEVEIINLDEEDNWLVNPEKLAAKIDDINDSLQKVYNRRKGYVPRVVAFLNTNPSNPTGKVMSEKDIKLLKEISDVCQERGVFVIDDLVYRDIAYKEEDVAKPIATIPGAFRNTISLFGLSKCYGMASLRAGFVVADEIIIRELINRIFQGMDSAPDIVGQALAGAFNTTPERNKVYNEYFGELRSIYLYKYNLLKSLVSGIDTVSESFKTRIIETVEKVVGDKSLCEKLLKGLPYVDFPKNLEPEAGFFAILDFTKLKGMKYKGNVINTEKDLLKFFYKTSRTRFLVGQSISWPHPDELVGRVTFALDEDRIINALKNMHIALDKLSPGDEYIIRKNTLADQAEMARIKVDGWRNAYDKIVSSKYLKELNYEQQTKRYIASFEEYKDLVLVAVKKDEVLGYSCFNTDVPKYDSELVSLYIKPEHLNKGIGTSLFKETAKELYNQGKLNMIVWCFKDNENARNFYQGLGGSVVSSKTVKIGDETYEEVGYYFDIEKLNENPFLGGNMEDINEDIALEEVMGYVREYNTGNSEYYEIVKYFAKNIKNTMCHSYRYWLSYQLYLLILETTVLIKNPSLLQNPSYQEVVVNYKKDLELYMEKANMLIKYLKLSIKNKDYQELESAYTLSLKLISFLGNFAAYFKEVSKTCTEYSSSFICIFPQKNYINHDEQLDEIDEYLKKLNLIGDEV